MKRIFSILLSLLIVGIPTAIGMTMAYRQAESVRLQLTQELQDAAAEHVQLQAAYDEILADAKAAVQEEEAAKAAEEAKRHSPISVDLDYWKSQNADVVGYIYSTGTAISYPIVQGSDNDYYLHRDLYGHEDINGCIMLEHLNASDFSHNNSILYGHHMKAGNMFASLCYYKDASFYPDHPCMYLYTPQQVYRVDLFAGFPCPHDDEVFATGFTADQIARFKAKSTFDSPVNPTGKILTMCTCSYEHDNWRYVVLGELVPIDD